MSMKEISSTIHYTTHIKIRMSMEEMTSHVQWKYGISSSPHEMAFNCSQEIREFENYYA